MRQRTLSHDLAILSSEPSDQAIINPADFLALRLRRLETPLAPVPTSCVLSFLIDGEALLTELFQDVQEEGWPGGLFRARTFTIHGQRHAYLFAGFGGPLATSHLEPLIALGVRRFVVIGVARPLTPAFAAGSLFVPDWAWRDEGLSHHYSRPAARIEVNSPLLASIHTSLASRGLLASSGGVWTTDAPYRQTESKTLSAVRQGCIALETELASILAVARFRGAELAALFCLSDFVGGDKWRPRRPEIVNTLSQLLSVAVESLART
ncbi:MAG: hypothetical protein EPO21_06400 [Chloroflexota bacterium]|nr:MAG: hypothetical protein EPO21_06400 [Chloroflexota bacterium]